MASAGEEHRNEALVADGLVRLREAAAYLGLSRSAVYLFMDRGDLAYVRLGRRARRIPRRALIEFAARRLVEGRGE